MCFERKAGHQCTVKAVKKISEVETEKEELNNKSEEEEPEVEEASPCRLLLGTRSLRP
jgi:hypothetical protein